jgi:hypothetical protein
MAALAPEIMDQSDRPRITGKLKIKKKNYGTVA